MSSKPINQQHSQTATEAKENTTREKGKNEGAIATQEQNDRLEHTEGGATTRDDKTDLGVPMLPGSGKERVMPEDALGEGDKRGDYTQRLGDANYRPHETVKIEGAKPGEAQVEVIPQAPRTEQIGDVEGVKGGVETDPNWSGTVIVGK